MVVISGTLSERDKYIMQNGLTLHLDCKTRWGSTLKMLKRFLEVLVQINHVLVDFKLGHIFPKPDDIALITTVTKALGIVDSCSRQLCARDATLSTADEIFEFMIGEMSQMNCPYVKRLTGAVQTRIEERRLMVLATLMAFLEDKDYFLGSKENLHLKYSDRNEIAKAAKELFLELKLQDCRREGEEEVQVQDQEEEEGVAAQTENRSDQDEGPTPPKRNPSQELRERLERKKKKINAPTSPPRITSVTLTSIKSDMKRFEGTGKRPRALERIYQALLSIQVTSCEAERSFRQDLHLYV